MSWQDLLEVSPEKVLPWFGFNKIHDAERSWVLKGRKPPEHGWYRFSTTGGRKAVLISDELQSIDTEWGNGQSKSLGYIVGNRFIIDSAHVIPDPERLAEQTFRVYCVEPGLDRFVRASVIIDRDGNLVYFSQEFPVGPEEEVLELYQDRELTVAKVPNVTPALDLAFRWITMQRIKHEERQLELERIRLEEEAKRVEAERMEELMKDAGSAIGRRVLATRDFEAAAREALRVSGAELLDTRQSRNRGEMVVQYRFRRQRLECTCDMQLRIISSGICLTDHDTGEKGDHLLTLESLPGTVGEAMDTDQLVVYRHA